jgi:hypothetical protein
MLRASQSPSAAIDAPLLGRKRQAESQDNERLSKRLSLLNLGMFSLVLFSTSCCIAFFFYVP